MLFNSEIYLTNIYIKFFLKVTYLENIKMNTKEIQYYIVSRHKYVVAQFYWL